MGSFACAHINERGQDMILVPLDETFAREGDARRRALLDGYAQAAQRAGLKGTVVPLWPDGEKIGFIAPKPWHDFIAQIDWAFVRCNLNRRVRF